MTQIASELGLSRLTVSSVLNRLEKERGVSKATAARFRAYVTRRGYVPAAHALRLRPSAHAVFGLLVDGRLYTHLYEALNTFADFAAKAPQRMEVVFCRPGDVTAGLEAMVARRIERFIWLHAQDPLWTTGGIAAADALMDRFGRVVVYNYHFPDGEAVNHALWTRPTVSVIGVDRAAAYSMLGRRLRELGHRRIALPVVDVGQVGTLYHRALAPIGIESWGTRPSGCPETDAGLFAEAQADSIVLAMRGRGVTAAMFADDAEAGYAMRALARRGVRVPADLSVTGFDGLRLSELFSPPLTTLRMPVAEMVSAALAELDARHPVGRLVAPMELLERESAGPAPRASGGVRRSGARCFTSKRV